MLMAFLLVVIVDGETVSTANMLFESIYRCNEFATAIEEGRVSPNNLKRYRTQKNLTAYCIPKMVNTNTELFK